MKKGRRLPRAGMLAALVALILGAGAGSGVLAEPARKAPPLDAVRVDEAAARLKKPEMPPAVFPHDKHTGALADRGMDCTVCHTLGAARPFAFRNTADTTDAERLKRLFHDGCIGCHADFEKQGLPSGPQDGQCRLCHDAGARFAADNDAVVPVMNKALHARHIASKAIPPLRDPFVTDQEPRNCGACHHVWDEQLKKLVWIPGREDNCAACHTAGAEGDRPALREAVHAKCAGCHAEMAHKARLEKVRLEKAADQAAAGDKENVRKKKDKKKNKVEWLSAVELGAGPETCAGCHKPRALTGNRAEPAPRLMRGQPDATVLLPVNNPGKEPVPGSPAASMQPVLFNHQAHEAVVDSCRVCHHTRIDDKGCTVCHTVQGLKEGDFVPLSAAMHKPDSERSCVGCHRERVMEQRECAGCHAGIRPLADKSTCAVCHREVKGLPVRDIADGKAFKLDREALDRIAQANLTQRNGPVPSLPASEMPETVRIGALSSEYEPAVMPHRKIYESLQKGIGDSALAAAFHTTPTAVCAACHHNSPAEGLRNPPRCSSCHGAQADKQPVRGNVPSLKAAYHQQCMACHERMGVKPAATDCTACHAERAKAER